MTEEIIAAPIPVAKTKEEKIVFCKKMRVRLDDLLQEMKAQEPSRNFALCITHMEDAILRLGMALKDLGTPNPYPNSYKPENTVVDPTADNLKL